MREFLAGQDILSTFELLFLTFEDLFSTFELLFLTLNIALVLL